MKARTSTAVGSATSFFIVKVKIVSVHIYFTFTMNALHSLHPMEVIRINNAIFI